jgi:hypothetical protein
MTDRAHIYTERGGPWPNSRADGTYIFPEIHTAFQQTNKTVQFTHSSPNKMSQPTEVVDALQKEQETRKYGVYQNEIYYKGTLTSF